MFKKRDLIIIFMIIIIILMAIIFNHIFFNQTGNYVLITIDQQEYQKVSLDQDQTIKIKETNTIIIKDKTVTMLEADCPDKLCIDQGTISENGQQIICLPNKVVVSIIADKDDGIDATVQ